MFLGVVLAIFAAELCLRAAQLDYGNTPLESDPVLHHRHPSNDTFLMRTPNVEYGGHYIHYDSEGLVSDPISEAKNPAQAQYRIAVMGDSFAEAAHVPVQKSFAGLMKQYCTEACAVKNYSVSSYSPILYRLQWQKVKTFKPTHVFLLLFSNDIRNDQEYGSMAIFSNGEIVAVPGPGNEGWQRLLRKSYFIRYLRKTELKVKWLIQNWGIETKETEGYLEEFPEIEPLTEKMLLALTRQIQDSGAKLILMAVPSKYRIVHPEDHDLKLEFSEVVKKWATEQGINFLDLIPAFQGSAAKERLFLNKDIHFNENGHRIIFETIQTAFPELFSQQEELVAASGIEPLTLGL